MRTDSREHRLPLFAFALVAASFLLYSAPLLSHWLVYSRTAIGEGEVWRFITGHMVHFSGSHLWFNLLVIGITGAVIEWEGYPYFGILCGVSSVMVGLWLYFFCPAITEYGGLSAIATASTVYLALMKVKGTIRDYWPWIAALTLVGIKIGIEGLRGEAVFASSSDFAFVVVPGAHIIGAVTALLAFAVCRFRARMSPAA